MAIVKLPIEHGHVARRTCTTSHQVQRTRVIRTIIIRSGRPRLMFSLHEHTAHSEIILVSGMQRDARPSEEIVTAVFGSGVITLILIGGKVILFTLRTTLILSVTISHASVSVNPLTAVIEVKTTVGTSTCISTTLQ